MNMEVDQSVKLYVSGYYDIFEGTDFILVIEEIT